MPQSLSQSCTAEGIGVSLRTYKMMKTIGMSKLIYPIMFAVARMPECPTQTIDCVEYFSGVGNICS
eukprot:5418091-Pyramimonas_sp.AAC.1